MFELIAWMLLNQLALVLNCYFKYGKFFGTNNLLGESPRYFVWYNALAALVFAFSWSGIIAMLYHHSEYEYFASNRHAAFGMATLAFNCLQVSFSCLINFVLSIFYFI